MEFSDGDDLCAPHGLRFLIQSDEDIRQQPTLVPNIGWEWRLVSQVVV